jgi:hypothetical protein
MLLWCIRLISGGLRRRRGWPWSLRFGRLWLRRLRLRRLRLRLRSWLLRLLWLWLRRLRLRRLRLWLLLLLRRLFLRRLGETGNRQSKDAGRCQRHCPSVD